MDVPCRYILRLDRYTYGVHCFLGHDGDLSARAFSVDFLLKEFGAQDPSKKRPFDQEKDFTWTRLRLAGQPVVTAAGWHLSTFGEPSMILRKLTTWQHADMFVNGRANLEPSRLERCAYHCMEPIGFGDCSDPRAAGQKRFKVVEIRRTVSNSSDLPAHMLRHPKKYSSFFRHTNWAAGS